MAEGVPASVAGVLRLHGIIVPSELFLDVDEPDHPGRPFPGSTLGVPK